MPSCCGSLFLGLGEADGALAEIVDGVVATEEGITKDGKRTRGRLNIHTHERRDAGARSLQNVVVGSDAEVVAREGEGDVRQRLALIAVNRVLAVEALLGTDLGVQHLSQLGGEDVQRGAGVENDTGVLELANLIPEGNSIEVNLPVGLATQGDLDDLAVNVVLVDAAKNGFRLVVLVGEVECKDGLINELLIDHLVEGRDDLVDRQPVKAQAEDAIESTKGERQARLLGSLGEVLVLDLDVADLNDIVGNETRQAARAVRDLELGAVLLVGRRSRRVILGVQVTGDGTARLRGDPEVGAASVKDNLEGLGRSSDRDIGVVCGATRVCASATAEGTGQRQIWTRNQPLTLRVHEVRDRHRVVALDPNRARLEDSLRVAVRPNTEVLLAEATELGSERKRFLQTVSVVHDLRCRR